MKLSAAPYYDHATHWKCSSIPNLMSAFLDFDYLYKFSTYINGFLDPEPLNFDHNHAFISWKCSSIPNLMSAFLDFDDLYKFSTYINGFLDPESLNFDHNHAFISCKEAGIISFLSTRWAFFIVFCLLWNSY